MGLFDYLPPDDDDLDNHHPVCKGLCGQLADECMCWWPLRDRSIFDRLPPSKEPT